MRNETMTMKVKELRELKRMQEELAAEIEATVSTSLDNAINSSL